MSRLHRKRPLLAAARDSLARSVTHAGQPRTIPLSPFEFVTAFLGLAPDPKQAELLQRDPHRCILNCTRQWGKSTITAAKAVHKACTQPGSLTIVLSPSARQSAEFVRKASTFLSHLHLTARGDGHNEISLQLVNKSRIIGLPSNEGKIRGFSGVSLLLIDEASRVEDDLYQAVRPMLATSDGQLWLMSTPAGRGGFFYREWISDSDDWARISIPASECPRISPRFLDQERRSIPEHTFRQEYCCDFLDPEDAVFPSALLEQALTDAPPLIVTPTDNSNCIVLPPSNLHLRSEFDAAFRASGAPALREPYYFIGVDLGQSQDFTAISVIERAPRLVGPRDRITFEWPRKMVNTVRHLERFPLGTPYPEVIDAVCRLARHPVIAGHSQIIIDKSGVGAPVVDMLRKRRPGPIIHDVTLTAGSGHGRIGDSHTVPRADLLHRIGVAFQNYDLQVSRQLPLAKTLLRELQSLRVKFKGTGAESIQPERSTDHDDCVFATAFAYWRISWYKD